MCLARETLLSITTYRHDLLGLLPGPVPTGFHRPPRPLSLFPPGHSCLRQYRFRRLLGDYPVTISLSQWHFLHWISTQKLIRLASTEVPRQTPYLSTVDSPSTLRALSRMFAFLLCGDHFWLGTFVPYPEIALPFVGCDVSIISNLTRTFPFVL
jgi:hypothetical protein